MSGRTRDQLLTKGVWKGATRRFRKGSIVLRMRTAPSGSGFAPFVEGILETHGVADSRLVWSSDNFPVVEMAVPEDTDIVDLATRLTDDEPEVRYAHPVFLIRGALEPLDELFKEGRQKGLELIDAVSAWDYTTGDGQVIIGIADSGFPVDWEEDGTKNLLHEDLDSARFDLGTDYAILREETGAPVPMRDEFGHGTHLAGIIAADTGSDTHGIAGVNWASPVYITRVLDADNRGYDIDMVKAVKEMVDEARGKGLRAVINLSLYAEEPLEADTTGSSGTGSETFADAFDYAKGGDVVIVVAAGNTLNDDMVYPASLAPEYDHVIAVGGTDESGTELGAYSAHDPNITLVAPGKGIFSCIPPYGTLAFGDATNPYGLTDDGTSMAAAFVTGVASLVWSYNTGLTPAEIKERLRTATCKFVTHDGHDYPFLDALLAITGQPWDVRIDPVVSIPEVEPDQSSRASIIINAKSCDSLTFRITDGPTASADSAPNSAFTTPEGASTTYAPESPGDWGVAEIAIEYRGTAAGDTAWGSVVVECVESGESWTVQIVAATSADATSAVVLSLDQSGSMTADSGIAGLKRYELLRTAARTLIEYVPSGNSLGIVSFDHDPHPGVAIQSIDAAEQDLLDFVDTFAANENGNTSIGDGIKAAQDLLDPAGEEIKGIIVLTDGKENAPELIADVQPSITSPLYAIGLGTADIIQPLTLEQLTADTGGYVVLTDDLEGENRFKLAKYYLQIYTNIAGEAVVVDPSGRIGPGREMRFPFDVARADTRLDVVLMMPARDLIDFHLETPGGIRIDPGAAAALPGAEFVRGRYQSFFRIHLPVPIEERHIRVGRWHAVVHLDQQRFTDFRDALDGENADDARRGVPFSLVVHARSGVRMDAFATRNGFGQRATIGLRAVLTQYGKPVANKIAVDVEVKGGGRAPYVTRLTQTGPGLFEGTIPTGANGVYTCRFMGRGATVDGDAFSREEVRTAHVWTGAGRLPGLIPVRP